VQLAVPPTALIANAQVPPLALQPGEILNALVLQLLDDGKVRIAIANTIMEVASQVPLVPGTTIQLAVKGTAPDLTLALVDLGSHQTNPGAQAPVAAATRPAPGAAGVTEAQVPQATVPSAAPAEPHPVDRDARLPVTALSQAVRNAAARQNGLAPLFADIAETAKAETLPRPVVAAMTRLLTFRMSTAAPVTATEVKQAFSRSGLFLEAHMARSVGLVTALENSNSAIQADPTEAALPTGSAPPTAAPDLKAALVVLRQVLKTWLTALPAAKPDVAGPAPPSLDSDNVTQNPIRPVPTGGEPKPPAGINTASVSTEEPVVDAAAPRGPVTPAQIVKPDNRVPRAGTMPEMDTPNDQVPIAQLALRAGSMRTAELPAEKEVLPDAQAVQARVLLGLREQAPSPRPPLTAESLPAEKEVLPDAQAPHARPAAPPPPYRGAPPTAQPPVLTSLTADTDPRMIGGRLLTETDAALARHTLLQVASLPDDSGLSPRNDPAARWAFEIPFATPQGTAIAQFEIARDGRTASAREARAGWRARFSLHVEPIGPVHVHIMLSGVRAAVTLWAEREASAAQLREDAPFLAEALRQAELEPGDVLVRSGEPPRPGAGTGRFLDRAS